MFEVGQLAVYPAHGVGSDRIGHKNAPSREIRNNSTSCAFWTVT